VSAKRLEANNLFNSSLIRTCEIIKFSEEFTLLVVRRAGKFPSDGAKIEGTLTPFRPITFLPQRDPAQRVLSDLKKSGFS
jgi:hypothetical protein